MGTGSGQEMGTADVGTFDLVILARRFYQAERAGGAAEAVGIRGERIAYVGPHTGLRPEWMGPRTQVLDAGARAVLPGFVDAHTHFAEFGLSLRQLPLGQARRKAEALEMVRQAALTREAGAWIVGRGWDESKWPDDQSYLTRSELDRVAPQHPVLLLRMDMHLASVNSRALESLAIALAQAAGAGGGVGADGVLTEAAAGAALQAVAPGPEELEAAILAATEQAHRLGVTSVHENADGPAVAAYRRLHRQGRLRVRVYLMLHRRLQEPLEQLGLATGFGDEWLRVGAVKLFTDGSVGARTAALAGAEYADRPGAWGELLFADDELETLIRRAEGCGQQLAIHALGDRAIDQVLRAFERVGGGRSLQANRHRIEHLELAEDPMLDRMARLGLVASMQPNFTGQWGLPGGMYTARLGEARATRMNRLRRVREAGIPLALGSDCMPFGPLYGLHWAVNGPSSEQRLPVADAIDAYTRGSAFAGFEEREKGRLAPGALADLVVLDGDPGAMPDRIAEMGVWATVVGGRVVYRAAASAERG